MSTIFDVFPTQDTIPTFRETLVLASGHLNAFLRSYGIETPVSLSVGLRSNDEESRVLPVDVEAGCWWPQTQYAWFHVSGIAGGTDAYANLIGNDEDDLGRGILLEDIGGSHWETFAEPIQRALKVGRYWSFRRSAGQPAVINIGYGVLAAALAELTGGFINSIDSAWDGRLLPAWPQLFFREYFRPEFAEGDWKEWVERCIAGLPDELRQIGDKGGM